MHTYTISVVMPVYNVEPFLEEAVDSLIKQTIGFENIQVILVNDGSTDGCAAICDRYAAQYPDNVMVLHKQNGGQARARYDGIQLAKGKYISFLDSDDYLSPEAFENVVRFFDAHFEETDVVAMPVFFTGEETGPHPLNYKFSRGSRVIDLNKEANCIQMFISSAVIKRDVAHIIEADSEIVTAEDAKEVLKVLMLKNTLGVVHNAPYNYRKRSTSTVGGSRMKKGWYNTYLTNFPQNTFDRCIAQLGYVPKLVQYTVMYDLQWKFIMPHIPTGILSNEEAAQYRKHLFSLLAYIDDDVIWNQKALCLELKIYLLAAKHPESQPVVLPHISDRCPVYTLNNTFLCNLDQFRLHLDFFSMSENAIEIEGSYLDLFPAAGEPQLYAVANGKQFPAQRTGYDETRYCVDLPFAQRKGFKLHIPLKGASLDVQFLLKYEGFEVTARSPVFGKHFPVSRHLHNSYYYKNKYMLLPTRTGLKLTRAGFFRVCKRELKCLLELCRCKSKAALHAIIFRTLYHLLKPFAHKNIWLITDNADRADDNGETFFLHCIANKKQLGCFPIFSVSKGTADYKRLKKHGPVVPYMSWRHKLYHLLAKHTISAYCHENVISPFLDHAHYYSGLLHNNKLIFLQHGIITADLSGILNKRSHNFSLFVTSAQREYASVLSCDYGYTDEQIVLTGLPRYDRLYSNTQKKITVMPTWRKNLFGAYVPATSRQALLPGFENSCFYRFYSALLNDSRLHDAMQKHGYSLQFLAHPVFFPYLDHFHPDPRVKVLGADTIFRDVFAESALVVTDNSSAAFDMAYLRKPVLYTHFDPSLCTEGYFDYAKDGFGEVEFDLDSTVSRIIEYMENGCMLKEEYRRRMDAYFAFHDKNNCQRVCEKILELDARR